MPLLVTTFEAGDAGEDRLNNLSMWLPQEEFIGFENTEYYFEYAGDTIRCVIRDPLDRAQLASLADQIDQSLRRIVAFLEPRTRLG